MQSRRYVSAIAIAIAAVYSSTRVDARLKGAYKVTIENRLITYLRVRNKLLCTRVAYLLLRRKLREPISYATSEGSARARGGGERGKVEEKGMRRRRRD